MDRIREKVKSSEFTAVTDIHLIAENERHRFVQETLCDAGVKAVPMEAFAVWTAKMRPEMQLSVISDKSRVKQDGKLPSCTDLQRRKPQLASRACFLLTTYN